MVIISNSIIIINDKVKRKTDKIDAANSVLNFVSKIEVIIAIKDSEVDVAIDINVSTITLSYFELSVLLFSTITAAKPNNIVNIIENTVVSISANLISIWYERP